MPGYNCSIKDRMLYSSCKKAVTDNIESFGIDIHKKVK
jgi:twinfilin-like protein